MERKYIKRDQKKKVETKKEFGEKEEEEGEERERRKRFSEGKLLRDSNILTKWMEGGGRWGRHWILEGGVFCGLTVLPLGIWEKYG